MSVRNTQMVVVIGGVGGSGRRVGADLLRLLGYYIGDDPNEPPDNIWFTPLSKRRSARGNTALSQAHQKFGSGPLRPRRVKLTAKDLFGTQRIVSMVVTAVLAIRNEEAYLANCLRHLVRNGIEFVIIDNGSAGGSAEIYRRREFAANLVDVQELPFVDMFSLADQLRRMMEVIDALDNWVVHLDADEVMHSYREGEGLGEALSRLEAEGWNAVNFDEFVFLPIECDYIPEASLYEQR